MNPFETVIAINGGESSDLLEIEVLKPGKWKGPNHPEFEITESDLDEYASNHAAGIRKGVPVDIDHRQDAKFGGQAAGWVKDVFTKLKDDGTKVLMASVEPNSLGKELIDDKRFAFISPEFVPRGYKDPEGKIAGTINNVLKAITITNHPLFKQLQGIRASDGSTSGLTYELLAPIIQANEGDPMKLEDVRTKAVADLSQDEKSFLTEHKTELSDAEQVKFGLKEAPKEEGEAEKIAAGEGGTILAADEVAIKASDLEELKRGAAAGIAAGEQLARMEAEKVVNEHVARGAIKGDKAPEWVERLVKADDATTTLIKESLSALPTNETIKGGEKGSDEEGTLGSAAEDLDAKAEEIIKASEGKTSYVDAVKQALAENETLRDEYNAENNLIKGGK